MIKYIKKNKKIINDILLNASSLSFYTLISLSSLFLIINFLLESFSNEFKLTIVSDLINIIGLTFSGFVNQTLKNINSFNIILIISLILSASSIISRYNKYCDYLYYKTLTRKSYHNRISSIMMFLMLFLILIFLLVLLVYGNTFIKYIFKNDLISKVVSSFLELFMIYLLIIIILIYLPPIKMSFKMVNKESVILTLIIYLLFKLFVLIFNLLYYRFKIIGLLFVFSLISYLIFIIHFVVCFILYLISKKRDELNCNKS